MKTQKALLAFFVSGAIGFVFSDADRAEAVVNTVAGPGCGNSSYAARGFAAGHWSCSLPMGSAIQPSQLNGVYFDYLISLAGCSGNGPLLILEKKSYSGSYYQDYTASSSAPGRHDSYLAAAQIKSTSAPWDYVWASIELGGCSGSLLDGVAMVSQ